MLSQSSLLPVAQFLQSFSDISDAITHLYKNTEPLLSMRDSLLHINPRHPLPSNPWLSLGRDLEQLFFDLTATQKEYDRLRSQHYNQYVQGIKYWKTDTFYPDADGSLRISFGTILSNENIFPSTSLLGKGSSLLYEYHRRIPFFVSNVDATHGSSGSVTINQKGEWIGLLFGGNDNRHTSDFFFAKNTGHHHISTSNILWYFSSNPNWKNIISEMMQNDE
jgi:hypothetical protein